MPLVFDSHVHIYPEYPLEVFFNTAFSNLKALASRHSTAQSAPLMLALILTERFDCHFFKELSTNKIDLRSFGYQAKSLAEEGCLAITNKTNQTIYLYAGRQIVTKERLEILALTADVDIADGQSFSDVMKQVIAANAMPVLNWAPGKWMFKRWPIVKKIIEEVSPEKLLICDTTLRPSCYPEPCLMKEARKNGFKLIAGSDPLPLPGEEALVGSYGIYSEVSIDVERPVSSMHDILLNHAIKLQIVGKRGGVVKTVGRLVRHSRNKH
jgi:hypothetical protein